jgi:hypothetical protein
MAAAGETAGAAAFLLHVEERGVSAAFLLHTAATRLGDERLAKDASTVVVAFLNANIRGV